MDDHVVLVYVVCNKILYEPVTIMSQLCKSKKRSD